MGFVELLKKRAKESVKTIVLPETEDMRTLEATDKILKEGVAKIILIGNEEEINKKAAEGGFDISGAQIVDPEKSDRTQAYIDKFVELRAKKGMTPEKAKEILHTQYPYYGVMMVKMGDADGMVSGACHSTADTLRPCLQILKTKPGTKLVSAFFLIVVHQYSHHTDFPDFPAPVLPLPQRPVLQLPLLLQRLLPLPDVLLLPQRRYALPQAVRSLSEI